MRTVLYISLYTGMGGGEISLLNLMSHLDPTQYRPVLLVPENGPLAVKAAELGIRKLVEPFPVFPLRNLIRPHCFASLMRAGGRVRRRIEEIDPDIVQCSDVLTLLLLLPSVLRKQLTIVFSMIFFYEPARIFLLWILDRMFVSHIVTCSSAVRDDLLRHLPALKSETSVIYNGVDSERFTPLDASTRVKVREQFGIPTNARIAGLIARYDTWKGHLTFLKALETLRATAGTEPVLGLIAGSAFTGAVVHEVRSYHDRVLSAAAQLQKDGALMILDHTDDVQLLMGCLDVVVCPSDREPYGLVVLEALAVGVPVVASTTVGALEVLPDLPQLHVFEAGDHRMLANSIHDAMRNSPNDIAKTAMRTSIMGLNWQAYSDAFSALYNEL